MALAVVFSRALVGLQAPEVRAEVHLGNGLPAFQIVGLPAAAVRESRDRVRAALLHTGFEFPNRRLTVSLAPADLPKDSGRFDLPIAIGILAASGQVPAAALDGLEFVGELSLTGELRPVRGALAMLLAGRDAGPRRRLVMPSGCRAEASLLDDHRPLLAGDIQEVCAHLRGEAQLAVVADGPPAIGPPGACDPLAQVRGQALAKRALEVAAAGGHSLLMIGPPGAGKTMLAQRFAGLLPPMEPHESLECALVQSIAGRFDERAWGRRPFRSPHHTASGVALVGGGGSPRPGEASLAHRGVLFLDELPEFDPRVLEVLREPLESGEITISRAARQATFPARFQLVAAMNPCPCGHAGSPGGRCTCSADAIARYQRTISGPLLDRIDIRIFVEPVAPADLEPIGSTEPRTPSGPAPAAGPRERVLAAVERQRMRQRQPNALLDVDAIDRVCTLAAPARALLRESAARLGWSARAYHRVLRVARTIADLAGATTIEAAHLGEAIQYRRALASAG